MISNKKTVASLMLLAAATSIQAAVTQHASQNFEAAELTALISSFSDGNIAWSGYGAVTNLEYTYAGDFSGFPISGTHKQFLTVNGELSISKPSESPITETTLVDMMVQATLPCEALTLPETAATKAQMAVGVDLVADDETKAALKVWCKAKGQDAASWVLLKEVAADSWHRVSFLCDYANKRCQIRLDGEPCLTAGGYLSATTTDATENGSWYPMALDATQFTGVDVLGLTAVDDVLVTSGAEAAESFVVEGHDAAGIDYAWYDKYGLAWDSNKVYETESGLNLVQKFQTGMDPFATDKFKITAMSMAGEKTTFTVPEASKAKLAYSATPDFKEKTTTQTSGTSVELDVTADDVRYFRLESDNGAVVGENACGWVKITSSLTNTVIGVPWMQVGSGEAVKVANLVKTDNLTAGDYLYVYLGTTWYAYVLEEGAWKATTTVGNNGPTVAQTAQDQTLARGAALFIQRQNPKNGDVAVPFYIYGQYTADAATTTVTAGKAEEPVYTLCASPTPATFDLNAGKIANAGEKDEIIVPLDNGQTLLYTLKDGKWGMLVDDGTEDVGIGGGNKWTVTKRVWKAADPIALGQGFWYVSKGGAATINW